MPFTETCKRLWREMSVQDRKCFLERLKKVINWQPTFWDGMTIEEVAAISSFDDLPGDLHGQMVMAMTYRGFSISEYYRMQEVSQTKYASD